MYAIAIENSDKFLCKTHNGRYVLDTVPGVCFNTEEACMNYINNIFSVISHLIGDGNSLCIKRV